MTETTERDYQRRMVRVLEHIQANLDCALSPAELAEVACFSSYHFQRIFRGMIGETVMGHLRRLRLERAAWRLKFGDRPVTQLAFEAGYETHEAFTRAFHERFALSPSEFRKAQRKVAYPAVPSGVHYDPDSTAAQVLWAEPGVRAVEIRSLPARQVAYSRHVGPYDGVGEAWNDLMTWVADQGLIGPGIEMLGLCHDDPQITASDRIRYDACVTVGCAFEPAGKIGRKELPGGEYAVARHTGPYDQLGDVYLELIGGWLPRSGREAAHAPCIEKYWNDPDSTPAEELETDIFLPLV